MFSRVFRFERAVVVLAVFVLPGLGRPALAGCERCGWEPPKTKRNVTVGSVTALKSVLTRATRGTTILLTDGIYKIDATLHILSPGVVLRGKSGNRSKVIIRGEGMTEKKVGVAISIDASDVVVADLTVGSVQFHGIQVRGEAGANDVVLHNILVADTGQQLLKGSTGPTGKISERGLVACSVFSYTDAAPSDYTNGVDVLNGKNWLVRDNFFHKIRGPREGGYMCGPAILFWVGSQGTIVERNLLLDCYRGISFGLIAQNKNNGQPDNIPSDHKGGIIRNNIVVNRNPWGDESIEANDCPGVRIEHNTVLAAGKVNWSISVRFPGTEAIVRNNLTNRTIFSRDGGRLEQSGNVTSAQSDWFTDPERGILRLKQADLAAVDSGVIIEDIKTDFDRAPRVFGKAADAGAFEFGSKRESR